VNEGSSSWIMMNLSEEIVMFGDVKFLKLSPSYSNRAYCGIQYPKSGSSATVNAISSRRSSNS